MVKACVFLPIAGVFAEKGVQDVAVMLQLRQLDSLMAESKEASPDQISAMLQKHALEMVNTGVAPTYTSDERLDEMKGFMNSLVDELKSDIEADQQKIKANKDNVVEQYEVTIRGNKGVRKVKRTKQSEHNTCRTGEDKALKEEAAECNKVEAHWTGQKQPKPCPAKDIKVLIGSMMWKEDWGSDLDGLVGTCKAKQTEARKYTGFKRPNNKKDIDCHKKQQAFEAAWCSFKSEHQAGCELIEKWDEDYKEALLSFKKHSHMIQSAKKVNCFIDVIKSGGNGGQLDGAQVEGCVKLEYNTAEVANKITVSYADSDSISLEWPSPGETCNTEITTMQSGSDSWKTKVEYSTLNEQIKKRLTPTRTCPGDSVIVDDRL